MNASLHTARFRNSLLRLGVAVDEVVTSTVDSAANFAAHEAKATSAWHDRSGRTRASVGIRRIGSLRVRLVARGASSVLNSGSGLYGPRHARYPIVAVNRKVLRFVVNGRVVFRTRVSHPGVKPTHFIDKARDEGAAFLRETLIHRLNEAIQRGR